MELENVIYIVLLALHNLALVMCVAGPFYMGRIVAARKKHGKKLIYSLDSVVEDVITSQPMLCWLAIIVLFATGFGFTAVYFLLHDQVKATSTAVIVAFGVKHVFVLGIVGILFYGTFVINPKLKELFAKFKEGEPVDPETDKKFFALRGVRKKWCDRCLVLGVLVLLLSPILRFSEPPEPAGASGGTGDSTEAILLDTNLKTSLSTDELMKLARERQPEFRAIAASAGLHHILQLHHRPEGRFEGVYTNLYGSHVPQTDRLTTGELIRTLAPVVLRHPQTVVVAAGALLDVFTHVYAPFRGLPVLCWTGCVSAVRSRRLHEGRNDGIRLTRETG